MLSNFMHSNHFDYYFMYWLFRFPSFYMNCMTGNIFVRDLFHLFFNWDLSFLFPQVPQALTPAQCYYSSAVGHNSIYRYSMTSPFYIKTQDYNPIRFYI